MELIPRLMLDLLRLSALDGSAQLALEPPATLLEPIAGPAIAAAASAAFAAGERREALVRLGQALLLSLREPTARQRLGELATAADALLAAAGAVSGSGLASAQLRLDEPLFFHLLRLLRLSPPTASPQILLVGTLAGSQTAIELPLGLPAPLDGLSIGYSAAVATPFWRSDLWVRVPPDPNKRRLGDWPANLLSTARRIELYRQRLPGYDPEAVILTEPVGLPHQLTAGTVNVELLDPGNQLMALRSTILDKFQAPLVIVERIVPQL